MQPRSQGLALFLDWYESTIEKSPENEVVCKAWKITVNLSAFNKNNKK